MRTKYHNDFQRVLASKISSTPFQSISGHVWENWSGFVVTWMSRKRVILRELQLHNREDANEVPQRFPTGFSIQNLFDPIPEHLRARLGELERVRRDLDVPETGHPPRAPTSQPGRCERSTTTISNGF